MDWNLQRVLELPAIQHELSTDFRGEFPLLAALLGLDAPARALPFSQSGDDLDQWILLLVSQYVRRTGGMPEYRELLRALRTVEPSVIDRDHGEFERGHEVDGWRVHHQRTRDLAVVALAEQSGAAICQWSIAGDWTWSDERSGTQDYRPCPGGVAEVARVEDGRLLVSWYGDDYDVPERTVELVPAGGWIQLLTVHRMEVL